MNLKPKKLKPVIKGLPIFHRLQIFFSKVGSGLNEDKLKKLQKKDLNNELKKKHYLELFN